ncbi:MAG TPA: hypothetical protein VGE24_02835, partial [Emticicia sp.]
MERNKQQSIPNVLKTLAQALGTELKNRKLEIPEKFGRGYCSGFIFNENIRMLICNYELNQDVVIDNPEINRGKRTIFFKFQNIFPDIEIESDKKH